MSKLKTSWVKTDIPKEIKVKFWKVMRDNPTHGSFIGYLNKHPTEFPDDIEHYFPLSPQRYKKLKDEIIQMPLEEVDTLPIELQSWILALRPDLKKEQTEQEAKKATATTSGEPYKETSHKRRIRTLAEALRNEIKSIMTSDSFILELKPGQLALLGEKLPVTISKDEIRVTLSNEGEGEASVLPEALCAHLETSGFAKVLTDIASWSRGMADNLRKYHKLFTTVRKKLERTYDTSIAVSVPIDSKGEANFTQSGLTMYFPVLICVEALEQARRSSDYIDFTYKSEGLNLKFGPCTIYIGTSDEHMQLFEDAHREWMGRCAMWKQTKAIAKQSQELDDIATTITKQLRTFVEMERLPGHCKLCS